MEALSSANQPKEVTEAEWRQALAAAPACTLTGRGVPLAVLDGWLSVDNPLLTGSVRRMVLAAREGGCSCAILTRRRGGTTPAAPDVVSVRRLGGRGSAAGQRGALCF